MSWDKRDENRERESEKERERERERETGCGETTEPPFFALKTGCSKNRRVGEKGREREGGEGRGGIVRKRGNCEEHR